MDFAEYKKSLAANQPPASIGPYLTSLWHEAKGDWEMAHNIIQDIHDSRASEIHAYLHRKEGDEWNADYWYRKSGSTKPKMSLDEEWTSMVLRLLNS